MPPVTQGPPALVESAPAVAIPVAEDEMPTVTIDAEAAECVICLGELGGDGQATRTLVCAHTFHEECVAQHLRQHRSCPVCRADCVEAAPPLSPLAACA